MRYTVRAIAVGLLLSSVATAQDDTEVTAAREVARQGLEAYDAGNYEEAADKLWSAFQVVKVPTVALHAARAFAAVGKLVEASELYLQATRLEASGEFQAEQERAQQDAARERAELMPRIPKLVVELEGAEPKEVTATVDGKQVTVSLLLAGYVVNPGTRRVEGKRGEESVVAQVVLAEGERKSVPLRFAAPTPAAAVDTAPSRPAEADAPADGSLQRTFGWVGLGVGGAGLLFGTVTGVMVLSSQAGLDDDGCVDHVCRDEQQDDVDSYNSMRTLSTVGFVVGFVGAAAGATLLLTAPDPGPPGPEVQAWVGVGAAGVRGRF